MWPDVHNASKLPAVFASANVPVSFMNGTNDGDWDSKGPVSFGSSPRRSFTWRARGGMALAIVACASFTEQSVAIAVPIDEPQVGGIGFSGPTTGDVAAVYWNPAALALVHGPQITVAGTLHLQETSVQGSDVAPGTGLSYAPVRANDRNHPLTWPTGPGAFAGVAYDVGGDRFTLAVATYMPFVERTTYQLPESTSGPTRYHRIQADLRNLALVPALAVRLAGDLRVGVAPGFLFSTGHLTFDGNTSADQSADSDLHYDLSSGNSLGAARFAVTLGAGLYYRRAAWEFGFSFSSRPWGGDINGAAVVGAGQDSVTTNAGTTAIPCAGHPDGKGCVFAEIAYKLPYIVTGAVTWHPVPGRTLTSITRILSFPGHDVVDIRLTGVDLATGGVPAHLSLYRGYGTVVDQRFRVDEWVTERLRIGVGVRIETAAVDAAEISAMAVDGLKFQPTAMVSYRPFKHFAFGAGYGFTWMIPVTTSSSVFNPNYASDCTATGRDITAPACQATAAGRALPSGNGTYRRHAQSFSLSATAQF